MISSTGDFMQNVAQSWLVWELTRSPLALGVVGLFDTVPRLIFGAVGGAIADRFDRRRILMITQSLAMAQAILYWLAVYLNVILFWHVCILAFFLGAVNTINQTARQSLVNSLIPKEDLLNAIGLQSSVFNFSKIVGPSAGGVIIALVGVAGCFFVNALSFVALLFNLHLMELPAWEERAQQKGMWNDIKEGYSYLRNQHLTRGAVRFRTADVCARDGRDRGGAVSRVREVASGGNSLDFFLCARVRDCPGLIRFVAFFYIVVFPSVYGRFLAHRGARVIEYPDSSGNAVQPAGTGLKFVLHGPGIVVDGQRVNRLSRFGHGNSREPYGMRFRLRPRGWQPVVNRDPTTDKDRPAAAAAG